MSSRTDAQAADWVARLQGQSVSAAERAEFERWLEADPAHAVAFARADFTWERSERLRALPESARALRHDSPLRHGAPLAWSIAATLAVVIVGALAWYWAVDRNTYATHVGERRTVALSDGSQVDLNTASRIEVTFDDHSRTVRLLSGEALFKAAHDPGRPFVVRADGTEVVAVGTVFNVRLQSRVVEVTVTEGKVRFDAGTVPQSPGATTDPAEITPIPVQGVLVPAGSAAVAAAGAVKQVSLSEDVIRRRVAWREGAIELKGETLEQAVGEFNRYSKSQLVVADPAIATLRVGGRFQTDEADKFVRALEANFSIRAVPGQGGNTYLMGAQ